MKTKLTPSEVECACCGERNKRRHCIETNAGWICDLCGGRRPGPVYMEYIWDFGDLMYCTECGNVAEAGWDMGFSSGHQKCLACGCVGTAAEIVEVKR